MKRVPLRDGDGSVRAYALVDDEDYDRINAYRWYLAGGYAHRHGPRPRRVTIGMHREVLGLIPGDGVEVDHVDRDQTLDNRRSNLRCGTHALNTQNLRPQRSYKGRPPASPSRGVSRWGERWRARVMVNGKSYFLGYFDDEAEAARAAAEGRQRLMEFATD